MVAVLEALERYSRDLDPVTDTLNYALLALSAVLPVLVHRRTTTTFCRRKK